MQLLAELRARLGTMFEIIGVVEDRKQAVDTKLRLQPDVLVLDISMPVMNGFQTARSRTVPESKRTS